MRRRRFAFAFPCGILTVLLTACVMCLGQEEASQAAVSETEGFRTLFDYVWAGGWVEAIILLASIAALASLADCWLRTRRSVTVPPAFLSELRRRLAVEDPVSLAAFCAAQGSLVAEALRVGLRRVSEGLSVMEAGAYQALEEGLAGLHARLTLPMGVAVAAPLFGFLGAVLRLIGIFGRMTSTSPPAGTEVARDVAASLVPLGTGLLVSVVVTALYFYLRRRITRAGIAASIPLREFLEEARQREGRT